MAAIFAMSSLASSSMMSMASSTVMMPTRRPSPSTTGSEEKSYFDMVCTALSWSSLVVTLMTLGDIRLSHFSSGLASINCRMVTVPSRWYLSSVT